MQTIICLLCACIVHGLPCEKVGDSIDFCVITAQRFQNISIWACSTFPIFFTRGLGCGFFEQLHFWTVLLYLGMPLVNDACHCYQINPSSHFFHAAKTFRASYSALSPRSHPLTRSFDSFSNAVPIDLVQSLRGFPSVGYCFLKFPAHGFVFSLFIWL